MRSNPSWARHQWYVAAFSHEVHADRMLARRFLGEPVVLYRKQDGSVAALADRCAHRRLPLSFGRLEGDNVVCGYHGMVFEPSGRCVSIPGQDRIPPAACVRSFGVQERHGVVWICVGDAAQAGAAGVPDLGRLDDADWVVSDGYTHLQADYRLLNDNLLDLSHVAFVHGKTIGNSAVAASPVQVTQQGTVVRVHRDVVGAAAPPFYAYLGKFRHPVHRWHTVNYHAPSVCVIEVGCRPLTAGDGIGEVVGCVVHMATPETDSSTHYFWAFVRNFRQRESDLTEYIRTNVGATHDEDKEVIELQQRALAPAERDDPVQVAIAVDSGPIRGRRMLQALIDAETPDATAVAGTAAAPALLRA